MGILTAIQMAVLIIGCKIKKFIYDDSSVKQAKYNHINTIAHLSDFVVEI